MTFRRKKPDAEWALAYVLQTWKRDVGPLVRKAYKAQGADRDLATVAANRVEDLARTLRAAADPKQTNA